MKRPAESQTSEERSQEWLDHEAQQEQDRICTLWKSSGVPRRHAGKSDSGATDDSPEPWQEARKKIVGRLGGGFLIALLGRRGTGKTQLASDAIRESCGILRSGLYIKALDLFVAIRETYGGSQSGERDVLDRFIKADLLVIDEAQNRKDTEWEDAVLTNLIDRRYDRGNRDTLLVSNLKREEFEESMGTSIISRMRETGGTIEATWGSFRSRA